MFPEIPTVLQDMVCKYAFDATWKQTLESLNYILEIKSNNIHPVCVADRVRDYTGIDCKYIYSRSIRDSSFFSSFYGHTITPFREFFVWFARSELWDRTAILRVLDELDWRCTKKYLYDCPFPVNRNAKIHFMKWVMNSPTDAAIYCGELFRRISINDLVLHPSYTTRYIVTEWY